MEKRDRVVSDFKMDKAGGVVSHFKVAGFFTNTNLKSAKLTNVFEE